MKEGKQHSQPIIFRIHDLWANAKAWVAAGDPPPKTQVKSLYLMVFLLIFGAITGAVWFLSAFDLKFGGEIDHLWVLFIISAMTLTPGLYALFISYHCWRRHRGYDWWIIPHFE